MRLNPLFYEQIDLFDTDAYYFDQNDVEIAAFIYEGGVADHKNVTFTAWMKYPCDLEASDCPGEQFVGVFGECSDERRKEIREFQSKTFGA